MFWSMSFQLLPGEAIIDSTDKRKRETGSGIKPSYSVFLTNKRVVFRFDSLRTSMSQSFQYAEIVEVGTCRRLFITYLFLKTKEKTHFLHVDLAEHWSDKIRGLKAQYPAREGEPEGKKSAGGKEKGRNELIAMLTVLRENGLLTEAEFTAKAALVREKFE
jgi:hypothetical protein